MSARRPPRPLHASQLAWLIPVAIGGALRLWYAASVAGGWAVSGYREEGYYDGAVNFLGYHVLADRVPSFVASGTRGPLFPAFIAVVESLFSSPHPSHALLAQAALGTLAIAAAFEFGAAIASPWAGLLAALWMALDAAQIESMGNLTLGGFYPIAIVALAASVQRWVQEPSRVRTLVMALTLAASLICRSSHYALPGLIVAACLALPHLRGKHRRQLPLFAAVLALLLGLPSAASYARFGRLVPMDAEAGALRFYATSVGEPCCEDGQLERYRRQAVSAARQTGPRGPELDALVVRQGLRNVLERPLRFAEAFAKNLWSFWSPYATALAFGLFAVVVHARQPSLHALLLVLLSFAGYHVMVAYRWHSDVVLPLLSVLAGAGLGSIPRLLGRRVLAQEFFRSPCRGGRAGAVLIAAFCGLYAATLALFAIEAWSGRSGRIARALADPASAAHRAPLRVLDAAVVESRGRFGLEERARVLSAMGLYREACEDWRRLSRLRPEDGDLAKRAGRCAAESALAARGLAMMKAELLAASRPWTMSSEPPLEAPCDWWGWAARGEPGLRYLDLCVAARGGSADSRHNRGIAHYLVGDRAAAAADFQAAVRADPLFAKAYISLSTALFGLGRAQEALVCADKAVRLARKDGATAVLAAALSSRASALDRLGRRKAAEDDRRRSRDLLAAGPFF